MIWQVTLNKSLHEHIVTLSITTAHTPFRLMRIKDSLSNALPRTSGE